MISHALALDYALQPGWMAPFIQGLQTGAAIARQCGECGSKSFPPQRTCVCGGTKATWVALPGTATIQCRTTGSDGDFALVQFDGAETSAVVRLQGVAPGQTRGRFQVSQGALPKMIIGPIEGGSA